MNIKRTAIQTTLAVALALFAHAASGVVFVRVPDMSQLKFQIYTNGFVYLWNMQQFDGAALGCCYNYYVDTNTIEGKTQFSTMLAFAAQGRGMYIGLPDGYVAGAVHYLGDW